MRSLPYLKGHSCPASLLAVFLPLASHTLARIDVPECYYPNRQLARGDYACDLSSKVSSCCAVNAICLSNGICATGNGERLRGSCTDRTWASSDCPQYCLETDTGGTDIISCQNVTSSSLDFCCDHTTDCCDTGIGRFRLDSAGEPTKTIRPAASTATRQPASSTTSTSTTADPARTPKLLSNPAASTATRQPASSTTWTSTPAYPARTTDPLSNPVTNPNPNTTTTSNSDLSTGAKAGIGIGVAPPQSSSSAYPSSSRDARNNTLLHRDGTEERKGLNSHTIVPRCSNSKSHRRRRIKVESFTPPASGEPQ